MCALLAASWPWLPSVYVASAISITGAAVFVAWIFLDCSFPTVAQMASQDIRFRFVYDVHLRWWHRWEWYGPRLLAFAIFAILGGAASLAAFFQFAFGGASQRSWASGLLVTAVVAIWFTVFMQYDRLWWLAFTHRLARLKPAMKTAVDQLLRQWPETSVFLPGLGNYGVSSRDPDRLLRADSSPVPDLWETIGGISRREDCCLGFGISSYMRLGDKTLHGCLVEYRMHGWSPPATAVSEVRSPPHTRTVHHEYDFPLGGSWYLAFYSTTLEFKDEIDPDILAEVAKRPPTTRLPHCGNRFRALRDTDVDVQVMCSFPNGDRFPTSIDKCALPKGEIVRLDYEPEPSRSTHCTLIPENYEELEGRCVDSKHRKDRDYAGYRIVLSYIELDKGFEWLPDVT
jgi:hypothetical protein